MTSAAKSEFFGLIREEFAPELRKLGFKGSGRNFRRIKGEVVNTINIQGDKYGGSVAVNLGLHLTFLPVSWSNELPDPSSIKEPDCEFRKRLAPKGRSDYWWKYEGIFASPAKQVSHLRSTYDEFGEPQFQKYDSAEKLADMIEPGEISGDRILNRFGPVTAVRGALAMARINKHIGRVDLAGDFARAGSGTWAARRRSNPHWKTFSGRARRSLCRQTDQSMQATHSKDGDMPGWCWSLPWRSTCSMRR